MDQSGRRHASIRWFSALFVLILLCGMGQPVLAIPSLPWANQPNTRSDPHQGKKLSTQNPSGRLREVEPPGAVQQLRQALAKHHPQLSLLSPLDGSKLLGGPLHLEFKLEDWPIAHDSELGLGAHVAIQIDDQAAIRISERQGDRLTLDLPPLSPGSHRFTAYAAYPWGEAVKTPGASLHWSFDQLRPLMGTQPEQDAPWLAVVSPAELGDHSPLLLDWLVWNAPLQNLRAGDARWRLRITVNEDSFVVDQQDALWLQGIDNHKGTNTVQMELLDGIGESITPAFNNQLRVVPERQNPKPIWLQSNLEDVEVARLLGETKSEDPGATQEVAGDDDNLEAQANAIEESSDQAIKEEVSNEKAMDEEEVSHLPPLDAQNENEQALEQEHVDEELTEFESLKTDAESKTALPEDPFPKAAKPEPDIETKEESISKAETQSEPALAPSNPVESAPASPSNEPLISKDQERVSPTSTLGGSARELLNVDGTQR